MSCTSKGDLTLGIGATISRSTSMPGARSPLLALGHGSSRGKKKKARLDDSDEDEEEVQVKRRSPYGMKKCNCYFQLKGEKSTIGDNWKLYEKDGGHSHKIGVYHHAYAQAAKLTDD
ncbi:hypothetical protein M9H77_13645 [Catharanthus roseus]|uniref:Uncharacterized protein n=1 Tax=Catharanthus roseus TaxID=4058 RepID=A0ACC0BKZ3_CATRO|nr:hypothetical protein M9H77_13645 [Catharanthus roseus]